MARFVVRKNTLPYVHQWAVIDTITGNKVGEYKTEHLAREAEKNFERYGLPVTTYNTCLIPTEKQLNAWNTANKRMEHPEGNRLPKKKPQHSDKRPVELD